MKKPLRFKNMRLYEVERICFGLPYLNIESLSVFVNFSKAFAGLGMQAKQKNPRFFSETGA
jgi:hypothetical protein